MNINERPFTKLQNLLQMFHFDHDAVLEVMGLSPTDWDDLAAERRELFVHDVVDILRVIGEPYDTWFNLIAHYLPVAEERRKERYKKAMGCLLRQATFIRGAQPDFILNSLNRLTSLAVDEAESNGFYVSPETLNYLRVFSALIISSLSKDESTIRMFSRSKHEHKLIVGPTIYEYDPVVRHWVLAKYIPTELTTVSIVDIIKHECGPALYERSISALVRRFENKPVPVLRVLSELEDRLSRFTIDEERSTISSFFWNKISPLLKED